MVEIFTVGGGDYLVNVFQAVSAWTGNGGYKSLIQVVLVMGLGLSAIGLFVNREIFDRLGLQVPETWDGLLQTAKAAKDKGVVPLANGMATAFMVEVFTSVFTPAFHGKDFPADGRWVAPTLSRTGLRLTLGGYVGLTLGWVEGLEFNLLGGVIGCDFRRPAIKLPGVGRIGL